MPRRTTRWGGGRGRTERRGRISRYFFPGSSYFHPLLSPSSRVLWSWGRDLDVDCRSTGTGHRPGGMRLRLSDRYSEGGWRGSVLKVLVHRRDPRSRSSHPITLTRPVRTRFLYPDSPRRGRIRFILEGNWDREETVPV